MTAFDPHRSTEDAIRTLENAFLDAYAKGLPHGPVIEEAINQAFAMGKYFHKNGIQVGGIAIRDEYGAYREALRYSMEHLHRPGGLREVATNIIRLGTNAGIASDNRAYS